MPDRLTDAEVKKALECCSSGSYGCEKGCPLDKECDSPIRGGEKIMKSALDLINRQEARIHQQEKIIIEIQDANLIDFKATIGNYIAENESLKAEVERLKTNLNVELENFATEYDNKIKAEAIEEFAERLREKTKWLFSSVSINNEIDNLLNELVGDGDGKRKD